MNLEPLGNGFAKVVSDETSTYFFRGKRITDELLQVLENKDAPTDVDSFTCEMAGL